MMCSTERVLEVLAIGIVTVSVSQCQAVSSLRAWPVAACTLHPSHCLAAVFYVEGPGEPLSQL